MSGSDPYLIPGTKVLRNAVHAHSEQELADAENDRASFLAHENTVTPMERRIIHAAFEILWALVTHACLAYGRVLSQSSAKVRCYGRDDR
ncbi:hypothetical protein [Bifidobacterium aquikefiri]|uniref:Uncharacterized protein n=1 Tax=Bifidobacterium aquikefiri TaxID=1653207 RepID=A0A261G6R3_9BIFI|nr:hypothetical protein [Bifidobacterium aquikefiri]OZG67121.1 hypothetical protein BAQU_1193 [Bifidobacterium aquikefiri]